jgi:hypothetical protein
MSTVRSNAENAGWNGRTTSPDGKREVTDESWSGGSQVLSALRAALARVISAIRAFGATLPAQAGKAKIEAPRFGDYEKVEEAKYYSPVPPSLAEEEDLPEWSWRPRVTLMAVDPYLVHVYWDFDVAKLPPDTTAAVLRFYDAASHFDVDVDLRTRNWYVPLWSPAKTYYVDLGAITATGEFIPLVRSNTIQTSRAWPVAEVEHRFVSGADASPTAAEPPAAEAQPTDSVAAPPTEQHIPKPPGAAEILRRRLSEIHEFRQWQPQAQRAPVESPEAIPPLPATPDLPDDLTAHTERQFSPGLSSLSVGAQGPQKPAG